MKDLSELATLFKDESNQPLHLVKGEQKIFKVILRRYPKRNIVMTPTQYGKSFTCALGVIIRAVTFPDKWCFVGATEKKAKIIMNYVIQHLFDNPLFYTQLILDTSLERLKQERSKERLTFRRGGEIFILSAQAKSKQTVMDALTGFGAPNVILDDSSLFDDDLYAMVKRMLGAMKDNFLMETGNPFRRNHFLRTARSTRYNKIKIDWRQAVREGRFTKKFIDEMRDEAFFKILYECEFPDEGEIDEEGWTALTTTEFVQSRMIKSVNKEGTKILGVDVARGGNYNAFVIRTENYAWLKRKDKNPDLMSTCGNTIEIMKEEGIKSQNVFMDDVGVGGGVVNRLQEQKIFVNAINEGQKPNNEMYVNKRAEMYFNAKNWLEKGGSIEDNEDFLQIADNRYKLDSTRRIKLMSKDEMRKRGIESPDVADALALTFSQNILPSDQLRITTILKLESPELFSGTGIGE